MRELPSSRRLAGYYGRVGCDEGGGDGVWLHWGYFVVIACVHKKTPQASIKDGTLPHPETPSARWPLSPSPHKSGLRLAGGERQAGAVLQQQMYGPAGG